MNISYIRAAIQENTGIRLSLDEVLVYLIEEKMITKRQARTAVFKSYDYFYVDTAEDTAATDTAVITNMLGEIDDD